MKNRLTILFVIFCPFLLFEQAFDTSLYRFVQESEKFQKNNESFEKIEQLFDKKIREKKGKTSDLAYLHAYKSRFYTLRDSLILAKKESDYALELAEKTENPTAKAAAHLAQVYIFSVIGEKNTVVECGKNGLKLSTETVDFFTQTLLNYKLYALYSDWDEVDKMRFYIDEALKIALKSGDYNLMANVYNGVSSTFLVEFDQSKNQALTDSAKVYLNRSFELFRKHPKDIAATTLSVTCNNIANHYLSYSNLSASESKTKAFEYLDIIEKMPIDAYVLASINGIKSAFALREKQWESAKSYLQKAQQVLDNSPANNWLTKIQVHQSLAYIAKEQGNFKELSQHLELLNQYQNLLFDENQHYNTQKIEVQFEVEKKNRELAFLATEIELKKKQNYLYIGLAVISLLGLVFLFVSYHFKLRYSLEKEKKAELEKNEAQMQIRLEQEEKQRLKAEQELLEIQKEKLQQEAMATALQIQYKNEVLKEIKQKISEGNTQNIGQIIKEEAILDADFEEMKTEIQKLHPHFFAQVQEHAVQKLSALDLKYCAYIFLKMSAKQIAQQLKVEPSSVRMFKYRLKQKFALPKEISLAGFLQRMGEI